MASTQISEGLSGDKPTSRVLRPPGGGSSNIFGTPDDTSNNNLAKEARDQGDSNKSRMQSSSVFGAPTESPKPAAKPETYNPITGESAESEKPKEVTQRMGCNPITGEQYSQPEKAVHTSTKVRQPPGGASSGLW